MNLSRDFPLFQLRDLIKGTVPFFVGEGGEGNLSVQNYFYAAFPLGVFPDEHYPKKKTPRVTP